MTTDAHPNYIAGRWAPAGDAVTENHNPSDLDDLVGTYAQASTAQVEEAIAAAKQAFPTWTSLLPEQRQAPLERIGDELIARKDELGRLLSREEGKPLAEGVGEIARAGQFFKFYAGETLRLHGDFTQSVRPGVEVEVRRESLGVVGIITPWNFPAAIPAWKIAPALAYGNTVVFKPADLVPGTAWALAEIISRAGLPDGAFNLVMGRGSVVGETILTSRDVAAVTFTGSAQTGAHVARRCAETMKKVQLEMGGKNPLVVLDDADVEVAASAALNGYSGTGQKCTASSRLVVTEGIHDRFVEALTEKLNGYTVGHALDENTKMGPVVDESQLQTDLDYIELGKQEGAELHTGGQLLNRETRGHYLSPALFTGTRNDMRINREEIFGPVCAVIKVKDYEEALATANDTDYGLTSSICTTSLKHASHFKANSKSGIVTVNLPTGGMDYHVPFGGMKASSYGPREQGQYAREFYTVTKTTYTKP
ncbi:aldehyde dehydrogenase (NAD+) [Limimonas halophila]|uniref:Aldehyde dehydrogenase (NAD+) n=1 Tax=Limimonas halophila TaxID=1082479 RepID=A0A1G7Q122_9PROT|nr:aldehyde dehydrogenase family protein [Limimonas halophila]SDF92206.1 aldehyde dehydrogenase (NAD+) [Limimonas halophila]